MSNKPFDYEEAIAQIRARREARTKPIGHENKKPISTGNGPDQIKWEQPKPLPDGLAGGSFQF
jgi:hypothetical protein